MLEIIITLIITEIIMIFRQDKSHHCHSTHNFLIIPITIRIIILQIIIISINMVFRQDKSEITTATHLTRRSGSKYADNKQVDFITTIIIIIIDSLL